MFEWASPCELRTLANGRLVPVTKWRQAPAGRSWEHTRYELEKHWGLQSRCVKGSRRVCSYFTGFHLADFMEHKRSTCSDDELFQISDSEVLKDGAVVVVVRKHLPSCLQPWIPETLREDYVAEEQQNSAPIFTPEMTEMEKLQLITDHAGVVVSVEEGGPKRQHLRHGARRHPSRYEMGLHGPVPPKSYLCKGCESRGEHFRINCPKGHEEGQGMDRRPKAHGILRDHLRAATDADTEGVMVTEHGETVVLNARGHAFRRMKTEIAEAEAAVGDTRRLAAPTAPVEEPLREGEFNFEPWLRRYEAEQKRKDAAYLLHAPRKKQTICHHYLIGLCTKTPIMCEYLHTLDKSRMQICRFYQEDACEKGEECQFRHVKRSRQKPSTEPMHCPEFVAGFCPRGASCHNIHERADGKLARRWGHPQTRSSAMQHQAPSPGCPPPQKKRRINIVMHATSAASDSSDSDSDSDSSDSDDSIQIFI